MSESSITAPKRTTTSDQAYDAILDAILDGRLRPDDQLRLRNLAASLKMSMMPVREAVRRLEALGVIEVEPYRGARVRPVSAKDLADTYRARILLEGYLARRAATRTTPSDHAHALACLDRQLERQEAGDREGASAAHRDFHFTIYQAADAPWSVRSLEPTWTNSNRYRVVSNITAASVKARRSEHLAILDACIARDPEGAEAALRDHLLRTVQAVDPAAAQEIAQEFGLALAPIIE